MKQLRTVISRTSPRGGDIWIKPVEGGFTLYVRYNMMWNPLKLVDSGDIHKIGDDVPIEVEPMKKASFEVSVRSQKTGVTTGQTEAVEAALMTAADIKVYGLLAEDVLYFEFHPVTEQGNLTVSNSKFSAEIALTIVEGANSDPDTVSMTNLTVIKAHPHFKNAALTTMFEAWLESLDADVVSAVLDTEAADSEQEKVGG
jgi:hypothetical protein